MEVIDLTELARRLPGRFVRTRELIIATLDLHSARSDLRIATDLAFQAVALIESPPEMEAKTYEDYILALTSSAIVSYAKATKSGSHRRRSFDIRAHLSSDEQITHERLCKLRDDSIAHYGPGGCRRRNSSALIT